VKPEHAAAFEGLLIDVLSLYDRPRPSDTVTAIWWEALAPFPFELVATALQAHAAESPFPPKPADIRACLVDSDGRPTADEAWPLALTAQDEAATVVLTAEAVEAWAIARPVLNVGDEVGARRTFLDAYARLVGDARRRLEPVSWSVSLGHDPDARAIALSRAVERRQITSAKAGALLPVAIADTAETRKMVQIAGLLVNKNLKPTNVHKLPNMEERNARRFLSAVREGLAGVQDPAERARAERERNRAERAERESASRAELLAQIVQVEIRRGETAPQDCA
jgi:hypothetical protein